MTDSAARQRHASDAKFVLAQILSVLAFDYAHHNPSLEDYTAMAGWIARSDRGISVQVLNEAWRATR